MYRCYDCGHMFEEGEQKTRREEYGEIIEGCPICGGAYEETEPCKICGGYTCLPGEDYCTDCKKDIKKQLQDFISQFTEPEKDLISDLLYDGEIIS